MNFTPFPILKSDRLVMRQIVETDVDSILFLRSDAEVNKFIQRPPSRQTKNRADAARFIQELANYVVENKSISWGITIENQPQIIGTICLWNFSEDKKTAEIGYDLKPEFHGQGYMNEAMQSVLNFGFLKLHLHLIEAFTHRENKNSIKLLESNGFTCMKHRSDPENSNNLIFEISNLL